MARPRVEAHRLRELVRLRRLGASGREVVRLLRMSPKTERRYRGVLEEAGLLAGSPQELPSVGEIRAAVEAAMPRAGPVPSTVEPWRERVEELLDKGLTAWAVYDRIRLDERGGRRRYRGSYSAVKRFVRKVKRERGAAPEDVAVPIPTRPGADYVERGVMLSGEAPTTNARSIQPVRGPPVRIIPRTVSSVRRATARSAHDRANARQGVPSVVPRRGST